MLSLLSLICFYAAIAQKQVINDPNAQVRNVSGFNAIKVSNAIDLFISQSNEEAVAVSAINNEYRDKIKTAVENGVLKIWFDDEIKLWRNTGNKKLRAYVSFKTLEKITASGACDVFISGVLKLDNLDLRLSGASDFKGEVQLNSLNASISGASDIKIEGTVVNLNVDASGACGFKGYDLKTETCKAEASGASDVQITVNKELKAKASGASSVYYKGNGVITDLKTGGASSVSKKS